MEWKCKAPLKLFWTDPYVNIEGKSRYYTKVVKFKIDHLERIHGDWIPIESKNISPFADLISTNFTPISCGQCLPCRMQKAREWANRLMLEGLDYPEEKKWFVTFTYDDENVPNNHYFDTYGQEHVSLTLRKTDIQTFFKELRKKQKDKLRFYQSGEYGERTFRPHHHAIIFGLSLDSEKLPVWKITGLGFTLYESIELEEIWNKGRVIVSPVSWDTACYVSRYVCKKLNGKAAEKYKELHIEPEFATMSRRPGIGKNWALKHSNQVLNGTCYGPGQDGAIEFSTPRYFRNLFAIDDDFESLYNQVAVQDRTEDKIELLKEVNCLARSDIMDYFRSCHDSAVGRMKVLTRSGCDN